MVEPVCLCSECKKGIYNPNEYHLTTQDFDNLRVENRKLGLSGHLRVKNEAGTIRECIESVISVLDELIITYQPSEDLTESILKELSDKYHSKIKLYLYKPYVISQHTSNEYPDSSSIHNLANYYNYGYTKISYKYYMKIDGDQVYFTDKLLKIKNKLMRWDKLKYFSEHWFLSKIMRFCLKYSFLDVKIIAFNLLKQKFALSLGGVNIVRKNNRLYMPLSPPPPLELYTFNGCVGDTLIWVPSQNERYLWNTLALYEYIPLKASIIPSGFAWCHFRALKLNINVDSMSSRSLVPIEKIRYVYKNDLMEQISVPKTHQYDIVRMVELHWESDKKYISFSFIKKYILGIVKNFKK